MKVFPTWDDMGVPAALVNSIKNLPPCYMIDSLVHQLIFRRKRKPTYVFQCNRCGHQYKPENNTEDVTSCSSCGSSHIRCAPVLRFSREVPFYSRKPLTDIMSLIFQTVENYEYYFRDTIPDNEYLDCGWCTKNYNVYAKFIGGDMVEAPSPRFCIIKAAILCPYLWDMRFDWSEEPHEDKMNTDHISPILHNYCHNTWIGKPE